MKIKLSVFLLFFMFTNSHAQDILHGTWLNEEKDGRIQMFEKGGKIYGKIVWLSEPTINGKIRVDEFNPDPKLKNVPLMGLVFLKGFTAAGGGKWEGGKIYDPKNGKTYSSEMTLIGTKQLNVRGYIGFSLLGRTTKWTKYD